MFDLLFYLKELVSVLAIAFCVATFCMSVRSEPTMFEAAKEVWCSFIKWLLERIDKKKEQKFFSYMNEISEEVSTNVQAVVGDTRFAELSKLAQSAIGAPLTSTCHRLGLTCIKVSVYHADANERQRLESLLTNVIVRYLRLARCCDIRVLADWTMRNDLAMPVLLLHFALTKEERENLDTEFESRSQKIVAKNTAVVDDTEEVDLF